MLGEQVICYRPCLTTGQLRKGDGRLIQPHVGKTPR